MKTKISIILILLSTMVSAQDIIVTNDSKRIESKIEEVSSEHVKYRKLSNPDGPLFVIPSSEIQLIVYKNGEVQMFDNKKEEPKKQNSKAMHSSIVPQVEKDTSINAYKPKLTGYFEVNGIVGKETTKALTGYNVELTPIIGGGEIHGVLGRKVLDWMFMGGGIGIAFASGIAENSSHDISMRVTAVRMPLYFNTRFYVPVRAQNFRPSAEVSIGLNIPLTTISEIKYSTYESESKSSSGIEELRKITQTKKNTTRGQLGAFFRVGIGGEYRQFIFGAGYELWGDKWECDHFAYFKIGGRFGKK